MLGAPSSAASSVGTGLSSWTTQSGAHFFTNSLVQVTPYNGGIDPAAPSFSLRLEPQLAGKFFKFRLRSIAKDWMSVLFFAMFAALTYLAVFRCEESGYLSDGVCVSKFQLTCLEESDRPVAFACLLGTGAALFGLHYLVVTVLAKAAIPESPSMLLFAAPALPTTALLLLIIGMEVHYAVPGTLSANFMITEAQLLLSKAPLRVSMALSSSCIFFYIVSMFVMIHDAPPLSFATAVALVLMGSAALFLIVFDWERENFNLFALMLTARLYKVKGLKEQELQGKALSALFPRSIVPRLVSFLRTQRGSRKPLKGNPEQAMRRKLQKMLPSCRGFATIVVARIVPLSECGESMPDPLDMTSVQVLPRRAPNLRTEEELARYRSEFSTETSASMQRRMREVLARWDLIMDEINLCVAERQMETMRTFAGEHIACAGLPDTERASAQHNVASALQLAVDIAAIGDSLGIPISVALSSGMLIGGSSRVQGLGYEVFGQPLLDARAMASMDIEQQGPAVYAMDAGPHRSDKRVRKGDVASAFSARDSVIAASEDGSHGGQTERGTDFTKAELPPASRESVESVESVEMAAAEGALGPCGQPVRRTSHSADCGAQRKVRIMLDQGTYDLLQRSGKDLLPALRCSQVFPRDGENAVYLLENPGRASSWRRTRLPVIRAALTEAGCVPQGIDEDGPRGHGSMPQSPAPAVRGLADLLRDKANARALALSDMHAPRIAKSLSDVFASRCPSPGGFSVKDLAFIGEVEDNAYVQHRERIFSRRSLQLSNISLACFVLLVLLTVLEGIDQGVFRTAFRVCFLAGILGSDTCCLRAGGQVMVRRVIRSIFTVILLALSFAAVEHPAILTLSTIFVLQVCYTTRERKLTLTSACLVLACPISLLIYSATLAHGNECGMHNCIMPCIAIAIYHLPLVLLLELFREDVEVNTVLQFIYEMNTVPHQATSLQGSMLVTDVLLRGAEPSPWWQHQLEQAPDPLTHVFVARCAIVAIELSSMKGAVSLGDPRDIWLVVSRLGKTMSLEANRCGGAVVWFYGIYAIAIFCESDEAFPTSSLSRQRDSTLFKSWTVNERALNYARNLLGAIESFNVSKQMNVAISVGIGYGPVYAAVVGGARFGFDVFGNAVSRTLKMSRVGTHGCLASKSICQTIVSTPLTTLKRSFTIKEEVADVDVVQSSGMSDGDEFSAVSLLLVNEADGLQMTGEGNHNLSDFDFVRILGRGSYGTVHLARHKPTKTYYAIKMIERGSRGTASTAGDWIRNEFSTLCKAPHPNIVRLYSCIQQSSRVLISMEYIKGRTLKQTLERYNTSDATYKYWFQELVMAIEHIHGLGILHRDIKPDNCMVGTDGHLKLMDFGLSKMVGNGRSDIRSSADPDTTWAIMQKLMPRSVSESARATPTEGPAPWTIHCMLVADWDVARSRAMILGEGIHCTVAENAKLALEVLLQSRETHRVHVVLLDVDAPAHRMSELDLIREMSRRFELQHIPVIVLSASEDSTLVDTARYHGASDFIRKPLTRIDVQKIRDVALRTPSHGQLEHHEDPIEAHRDRIRDGAAKLSDLKSRPSPDGSEKGLSKGASHACSDAEDATRASCNRSAEEAKDRLRRSVVGTPYYMAPEMVNRECHGVGIDWWSFGVLLYECSTGRLPFEGDSVEVVFARIRTGIFDCYRLRGIPSLDSLISSLLALDPKERLGFDSADQVKNHPYFASSPYQWASMKYTPPPFCPEAVATGNDDGSAHELSLSQSWDNADGGVIPAAPPGTRHLSEEKAEDDATARTSPDVWTSGASFGTLGTGRITESDSRSQAEPVLPAASLGGHSPCDDPKALLHDRGGRASSASGSGVPAGVAADDGDGGIC